MSGHVSHSCLGRNRGGAFTWPWLVVLLASTTLAASNHVARPQVHHQAHLLTNMSRWPAYTRGNNSYSWVLSKTALRNGITYLGAHSRLRLALDKLRRGQPITIGAIGGSITAQGYWLKFVQNYLADYYGPELINVHNGAVGSTTSVYGAMCHGVQLNTTIDIVLVEYAYNDFSMLGHSGALHKSNERLIRTLLSYPKRPAVVYVNTVPWRKGSKGYDNWWFTMESLYSEMASYYNIPSVSLRACCYHLLVEGDAAGFGTRQHEDRNDPNNFYIDSSHLGPLRGARVMAELVIHLFRVAMGGLARDPVCSQDEAVMMAPLPPPLLPHSHESLHHACYVADELLSKVTRTDGFEWINEGKDNKKLAKWGMIATTPGATVEVQLDTRSRTPGAANATYVELFLMYLASYQHMGMALVDCVSGCECVQATFDGHMKVLFSFPKLQEMVVTQHEKCVIRMTVANETSSGEYKVKLIGFAIGGVTDEATTFTQKAAEGGEGASDVVPQAFHAPVRRMLQ